MGRLHLFEFHDQEWFPHPLRVQLTETLSFFWCGLPSPGLCQARFAAEEIRAVLGVPAGLRRRVLDLCSGSGGPMPFIARSLASEDVGVFLSDLYPSVEGWAALSATTPNLKFISEPVDATAVPAALCPPGTVRCLAGSFHHFDTAGAEAIIRDAIRMKNSIVIIEATQRSLLGVLFFIAATLVGSTLLFPLLVWSAGASLLSRSSALRFLFTFVVPLTPFFLMFDGVVSCLRTYSAAEYRELVRRCPGSDTYQWSYRAVRTAPVSWLPFPRLFVFSGVPIDSKKATRL